MSGGLFSSAIGMMIMPLLTRIYAPEEFGTFAIFFSIVSVISVLACMRYEVTIVLPSSDHEAANLLALCIVVVSVFSLLLFWFLVLSYDLIESNFQGLIVLGKWIYLIPFIVFVNGVYVSLNFWNTRNKFFLRLSVVQALNQIIAAGSKLVLPIMMTPIALALIFSNIIARINSVLVFIFLSRKSDLGFIKQAISISSMRKVAQRYYKFPLYGTWSILLGVLAWQLPLILLAYFYTVEIVGFYSLAFSLLELPMRFVGGALGQVFYQRAVELKGTNSLTNIVDNLFQKLIAIFLFPMLLLTLIGEDLFTVVFGSQWIEAGIYAQIMSVWAFCWFVSAPFTKLFAVFEKQSAQMWWNILNFISRLFALCWAGIYSDPRTAILLLASAGVFVYATKILMTVSIVGVSPLNILSYILKEIIIFIPAAMFIILTDRYIDLKYGGLILALSILVLYSFFVINKLYPELKRLINVGVENGE